jgi:hypothetical protein
MNRNLLFALACLAGIAFARPAAAQDSFGQSEQAPVLAASIDSGFSAWGGLSDPFGTASLEAYASGAFELSYSAGAFAGFLSVGAEFGASGSPGASAELLPLEAWLGAYFGPFSAEMGLMSLSWGKADSLRLLDVTNARDLSDPFADPDESKLPEPMLRLAIGIGSIARLEFVAMPFFTPSTLALGGPWAIDELVDAKESARNAAYWGQDPGANGGRGNGAYYAYYSQLYNSTWAYAYSQAVAAGAAPAVAQAAANSAAASACAAADPSLVESASLASDRFAERAFADPEYGPFEAARAGVRGTLTLGGLDLGVQAFWGRSTEPFVDSDPASAAAVAANGGTLVSYPAFGLAGVDAAFVLGSVNARLELAYRSSGDFSGEDRLLPNDTIAASLGFDVDLWGVTLNAQAMGRYLMHASAIENPYDVEAGEREFAALAAVAVWGDIGADFGWRASLAFDPWLFDWTFAPELSFERDGFELALSCRLSGDPLGAGETFARFADTYSVGLSASWSF